MMIDNIGDVAFTLGNVDVMKVTTMSVFVYNGIRLSWDSSYTDGLDNLAKLIINGGTLLNAEYET